MTKLSDASLEFAKAHLGKFADSDFFPPLFEYEAVWSGWDKFKERITASNVKKLWFPSPITLPAPKLTDTFRFVHQLDPLACIAYTALAHSVAEAVEAKRVPADKRIACSYRISLDDGSFFAGGTGYDDFLSVSRERCERASYVLTTDVADFYNQIYSHRVQNALSAADPALSEISRDVEPVIHSLGAEASKGIPTGPNASIIFAESIFLDVDEALLRAGYVFCRYVDDIRIFANSEVELRRASEFLGEYLFNQHRLHLSGAKTKIWSAKTFLEREFFNHYTLAVQEAFEVLGEFVYGGVASVIHWGDVESDEHLEALIPFGTLVASSPANVHQTIGMIVDRIEKTINETGRCDLNLLKALLRRSRLANDATFLRLYSLKADVFLPVFHDLCKTLRQLYEFGFEVEVIGFVRELYESDAVRLKFVRYWADWLTTQDTAILSGSKAADLVETTGSFRHRASAAVITNDLSWVRALRGQVDQLGEWDCRALVGASRILGSDERKPYLKAAQHRAANRDIVTELLIDHVLKLP